MKIPKNILITGASSGIGAALAIEYAHFGNNLYLSGRDAGRLKNVADSCLQRGAKVHTKILDVTDAIEMHKWIERVDAATPLDLVIANAGVSAGMGGDGEDGAQVRRLFATNIDGVINTVQPVIPLMLKRKSGQIAIMSSLAGIRALPSAPAYSASKACVRYYGEALRGVLLKDGVTVSVICPGYIDTAMTAVNQFPMPFIMSAPDAAHKIATSLARGRGRIAFPPMLYIPLWFISCLSPLLTDWVFARLPKK